jgi:hypothetical protein
VTDPIPRAVARMFNFATAWVDAQWGEWGASPEAAQGTRCPAPPYSPTLMANGGTARWSMRQRPTSLAHLAVWAGIGILSTWPVPRA